MHSLSTVSRRWLHISAILWLVAACASALGGSAREVYQLRDSWVETVLDARASLLRMKAGAEERGKLAEQLWKRMASDFPLEWDWTLQDCGREFDRWFSTDGDTLIERAMIRRALDELGDAGSSLRSEFQKLVDADVTTSDPRWLDMYVRACKTRREIRLRPLLDKWPKIVFTKHFNLGGSHYAYTEAQSDAQHEVNFEPGAALCLLGMDGPHPRVRTLLDDRTGVIRDPDVSYDGKRVLFSWKKSMWEDDYHLYEMDVATGDIRQITSGLGFADIEGAYLPNDDILFNSTRCVQTVDCWWTEVSNVYTCDRDGKYLRRLGFDQVHSTHLSVMEDGRVLYTRWEYNDRAQIYPQPLFQMNYDGTGQTEFYGNNSWFPTTITHARGIPGSRKVVAILTGHHSFQQGKLAILDPGRGRQENEGVQLIAPVRETKAEKIDAYGQEGDLFQYPYPLSETRFLVAYSPLGGNRASAHFSLYFMDADGRRELLVSDPDVSCNQPVPLAPRKRARLRPSAVDYRKQTGTYYLQDIYAGPGLEGVPRGTVKRLRVVALDFRPAGIGETRNSGPGGGALASTPAGVGNTSWDPKIVLGSTPVHEDGSAMFEVPARTPVYFQALDENNHVVQTMRSWSTLQPGETFACVGCHESKNTAPLAAAQTSLAMKQGARELDPFYGPPRGFSFPKEIQPILDRHCSCCHFVRPGESAANRTVDASFPNDVEPAFSLLGKTTVDPFAKRRWSDSYLALTEAYEAERRENQIVLKGAVDGRFVKWNHVMSAPPMLPPYASGAAKSPLIPLLRDDHKGVQLSREEMDKIACWIDLAVPYCGDYTEAHAWTHAEVEKYDHYLNKRRAMERIERQNIAAFIADRAAESSTNASGY